MSSITLANINTPSTGLNITGGKLNTSSSFVSLSGANDWTLTASQVISSYIHVSSGTNSTLYTLNLPSAASLYTALGSTVGATCSFTLYAIWSFNIYPGSGGSLWGVTTGNASGVSQGVSSGSSGSSVVFNFAQNSSSGFIIPNSATYQITIRMMSSTTYYAYIK